MRRYLLTCALLPLAHLLRPSLGSARSGMFGVMQDQAAASGKPLLLLPAPKHPGRGQRHEAQIVHLLRVGSPEALAPFALCVVARVAASQLGLVAEPLAIVVETGPWAGSAPVLVPAGPAAVRVLREAVAPARGRFFLASHNGADRLRIHEQLLQRREQQCRSQIGERCADRIVAAIATSTPLSLRDAERGAAVIALAASRLTAAQRRPLVSLLAEVGRGNLQRALDHAPLQA